MKRVAMVMIVEVPDDEELSDINYNFHHAVWQMPDSKYRFVRIGRAIEQRPPMARKVRPNFPRKS